MDAALLGSFGVAAGALLAGCSGSGTSIETRTVTIHAPRACASGAPPYALGATPFALFEPLGDFAPVSVPPSLALSEVGAALAGFPASTEELVATVTGTSAGAAPWAAHSLLPPSGDVDLLALPFGSPCALTDPIDAPANATLGAIDELHVLLAGGTSTSAVPQSARIDLTRGVVATLAVGLLVPRASPSITRWSGASGGAVVAGGAQLAGSPPSFEIYSSSAGDFDGATYALSQARSRHGAVEMASGETLLVGGVDATGNVLGSMEAIDPVARRARTGGLAFLQVPRADPSAIRLASGEILVAGGVDGSGAPVSTLEWLSADGSQVERSRVLVASTREAFLPLAAGGALAIVASDPAAPGFQNVWVISADGSLAAGTPVDGLSDVRLFQGTAGEPVLWTGDRWLVWQAWAGAFAALDSALGAVGPTGDPTASPEPGLGVWVDGSVVYTLRFGTRGPYATTAAASSPLFAGVSGTTFTAPDRLVTGGAAEPLTFDPASGLTLQPGASVFLTDATFGTFSLDAETPGGVPPSIVLRDGAGNETVLDPPTCGLMAGGTIHLERSGATIGASVDGGALVTCSEAPASDVRVAIGVRGAGAGAGASVVRSLVVTRM